jgi:hypothetical protein
MYRCLLHGAKANAGTRLSRYSRNGIKMPRRLAAPNHIGLFQYNVDVLGANVFHEVFATIEEKDITARCASSSYGS